MTSGNLGAGKFGRTGPLDNFKSLPNDSRGYLGTSNYRDNLLHLCKYTNQAHQTPPPPAEGRGYYPTRSPTLEKSPSPAFPGGGGRGGG